MSILVYPSFLKFLLYQYTWHLCQRQSYVRDETLTESD
jgi:hypothetical protein